MSFAACKIHESAIKKGKHVFFCMHSHNGETEEMVSECGGGKVIVRLVIHIFKDVLTDKDMGGGGVRGGEQKHRDKTHTGHFSTTHTCTT